MTRVLSLVLGLTTALVASVEAQNSRTSSFPPGTRVVVVGPITSQPRDAGVAVESKLQVGIGPERRDYTLHVKDAALIGFHGGKLEKSDLKDKMWVRAEGAVMDDPRRISVDRLQVIGGELSVLRRSAFYRQGYDQGYVMAVAGTRETYPPTTGALFTPAPLTIVGRVSDDTGALETTRKVQVEAAGNVWTLSVDRAAAVRDVKGEKISVHEIKKGQWVRATGWQTDDLRMRIDNIENIGLDEAYRGSTIFRTEAPLGYVERVAGERMEIGGTLTDGVPVIITGRVVSVNRDGASLLVLDDTGREHAVDAAVSQVRMNGRRVLFNTLKAGDPVTVDIRYIQR